MDAITIKLEPTLRNAIDRAARHQGLNRSQLIRNILTDQLVEPETSENALDRFGDLVGCAQGPADLSTNPRYLDDLGH